MVTVLKSDEWDMFPLRHGFSTRNGGLSSGELGSLNMAYYSGDDEDKVKANRNLYFRSLGVDARTAVFARQVHGKSVFIVDAAHTERGALSPGHGLPDCDGLVTALPFTSLNILTADCLAALFYDPVQHIAGACHAGWRGSALGVVDTLLQAMHFVARCQPTDIRVLLGPAASWCCYEVDDQVTSALENGLPQVNYVRHGNNGKPYVDLRSYNTERLVRAGVRADHVVRVGGCTICDPLFFSHRRQQGRAGRMAATIELLSVPAGFRPSHGE